MRIVVIIISRMPYIGAVKTRLARDIGAVAATKLYRETLSRALQASAAYPRYLALTPAHLAFSKDAPYVLQSGGDLGQRLDRLARRFAPVIFVASDSLAIRARHLRQAQRALKTHDVVIAPADDGGYGLIGLRNPYLPLFRNIRWSSAHTLDDTLARVKHRRVCLIDRLPDIDHAQDLARAKQIHKIARARAAVQ